MLARAPSPRERPRIRLLCSLFAQAATSARAFPAAPAESAGAGELFRAAAAGGAVASAFSTMRLIVLVGWSIYPLGYVLGYMTGTVDPASLNGIYNIADFVNKIAFGLMIWAAATSEEA